MKTVGNVQFSEYHFGGNIITTKNMYVAPNHYNIDY